MNEVEYKEWLYRYIHLRTVPQQELPALVAALRGLGSEIERAYQESRGGQP